MLQIYAIILPFTLFLAPLCVAQSRAFLLCLLPCFPVCFRWAE
jgi:hypothetical protein